jgi:hypothetical protein
MLPSLNKFHDKQLSLSQQRNQVFALRGLPEKPGPTLTSASAFASRSA